MLQKAKKKKYMVETLKPLNVLYDHELWLTLQDVDLSFSLTVFLKEIYTFVSKGTSMRNILYIIILAVALCACNNSTQKGRILDTAESMAVEHIPILPKQYWKHYIHIQN